MVAGSRILFHALNYMFNRESLKGKKILIYGADWKGMIALQTILQAEEQYSKIPVGFLDDDPELEGKYINGYPIFGGHWKLENLIKKGAFDEIIMTQENVRSEIQKRIRRITDKYKIPIHLSKINFENFDVSGKYRAGETLANQEKDLTPNAV